MKHQLYRLWQSLSSFDSLPLELPFATLRAIQGEGSLSDSLLNLQKELYTHKQMNKSPRKSKFSCVDISNYVAKIFYKEDRPLFEEAVAVNNIGSLRAAYVMIWLACAESLKFRFREAAKRDNTAAKIVGEINKTEKVHKAVDNVVLNQSFKYGFISDSGHKILSHIYEMRCLYAHPYEEAPSKEQVSYAASVVIEHVLSHQVRLRHGFCNPLLKSLLSNRAFLDDQKTSVTDFAKDILPRIDESLYGWFLNCYWKDLEKISNDPSLLIFYNRGIWFSRMMLRDVGVNIFSLDDWHNKSCNFPKVLMRVCDDPFIFKEIGNRATDSLVGLILDESNKRASVLRHLEKLSNHNALNERQQKRFEDRLSQMKLDEIKASGLRTKSCYKALIKAMESHYWYSQNPAVDLVIANGRDQAAELDEEQQVNLGRNLLQSAEGTATSAKDFIAKISNDGSSWPINVVRGIALELFINENKEIRFKTSCLEKVLISLSHLEQNEKDSIIDEIAMSITEGKLKNYGVSSDSYRKTISKLKNYPFAAKLIASLENRENDFI